MVEEDEDKRIQVETSSGLKIPPTIGLDLSGLDWCVGKEEASRRTQEELETWEVPKDK